MEGGGNVPGRLIVGEMVEYMEQKGDNTTVGGPGLEICLAINPDISPGESKAEGVLKAKGQVITWSVVAEVKQACVVLQAERAALKSDQEERLFERGEEEYEHILINLKAMA